MVYNRFEIVYGDYGDFVDGVSNFVAYSQIFDKDAVYNININDKDCCYKNLAVSLVKQQGRKFIIVYVNERYIGCYSKTFDILDCVSAVNKYINY